MEMEMRGSGDLVRVREEIEAVKDPAITLLDVHLSGLMQAEERGEIDRILQIVESRFMAGRLDVSGLLPSPEDDSWLLGLPAGIIREAANRLRTTADTPGSQSQIATRALMELYAIAGEVER
jgi:hypothetical protein